MDNLRTVQGRPVSFLGPLNGDSTRAKNHNLFMRSNQVILWQWSVQITFSTLIFKLTSISVSMSQKCLIGLKRITRVSPLASMLIYLNVRLLVEAVYNLCFTATFNTSPSLVRVVGKIMRGRLEPRVMTENHENSWKSIHFSIHFNLRFWVIEN